MILPFILAIAILFLDQVTKMLISSAMYYGESVSVFGRFFQISFIENSGMAFGFMQGHAKWLGLVSLAVSGVLIYWIRSYWAKPETREWSYALGCILGGAFGNLIDRFLYGRVVDFLDFGAFGYRWPAFNIADMAITSGVIWLLLLSIPGWTEFRALVKRKMRSS